MITAIYETKRGGSAVRTILNKTEAEKILQGGYGATWVRLEDENGNEIGSREYRPDFGMPNGTNWWWYYDPEAFDECESSQR